MPAQAWQRPTSQGRTGSQPAAANNPSADLSTAEASGRTVSGRVVNMLTGSPVPRALVRINSHGVLTDSEGRFEIAGVSGDSANIQLLKPGFSVPGSGWTGGMRVVRLDSASQAIELHLVPDALITGTVVSRAGEPLARVPIHLQRMSYNQIRGRLAPSLQTFTNLHGEFRFSVPAGDYVLETQYVAAIQGGTEAILPVRFPEVSLSAAFSTMRIKGGEERTLELRPETSPSYLIRAVTGKHQGLGGVTAIPSRGLPLTIYAANSQQGEIQFRLPRGTYTVRMTTRQGDSEQEAVTRITVPDHDISGVVFDFLPLPAIPVEMEFEPSSASDNGSRPQQANIVLEPVNADGSEQGRTYQADQSRRTPGDPTTAPLIHAPVGTYRVTEMGWGGTWYIKAITFGGSDLLTQNLTVAPGGDGTPIRVRFSDQVAGLSGAVTSGGRPLTAFLYLIPTSPTLAPSVIRHSDMDGKFNIPNLAPGSYDVLASEMPMDLSLTDAAVRKRLAKYTKTISLGAGDKPTVALEAVPEAESQP